MPIDLSDGVLRSFQLTSATGLPVDADTLPVYTITKPDLTAGIAPTVQHGGAAGSGDYYVVYPAVMEGLHRETLTATVGGIPVVVNRQFIVEAATQAGFLDTDEVIAHLNLAGITVRPADMEWLRWLCMVSSAAVEKHLNRYISPRAVTKTYDGGTGAIVLTGRIISITAVTENGVTVDPTGYTYSANVGILYRGGQQSPQLFGSGRQNVTVTAVVGYTSPPLVARQVAMTIVARSWMSSRQMPHPALDDIDGAVNELAAGTRSPGEIYSAYLSLRQTALA